MPSFRQLLFKRRNLVEKLKSQNANAPGGGIVVASRISLLPTNTSRIPLEQTDIVDQELGGRERGANETRERRHRSSELITPEAKEREQKHDPFFSAQVIIHFATTGESIICSITMGRAHFLAFLVVLYLMYLPIVTAQTSLAWLPQAVDLLSVATDTDHASIAFISGR